MDTDKFLIASGRHERYLRLAQKLSLKSDVSPYRMASVVVRGGKIISMGINKSNPGILKHPAYALKGTHSELDAILSIDPKLLKNSTIYISGLSRGNNTILSKPCDSCQQIIKEYGIKAAIYHTRSGEIKKWKAI